MERRTRIRLAAIACVLVGLGGQAGAQGVRICPAPYLQPALVGAAFAATLRDVPATFRASLTIRVSGCEANAAFVTVSHVDGRSLDRAVTFDRPDRAVAVLSAAVGELVRELAAPAPPDVVGFGPPAPGSDDLPKDEAHDGDEGLATSRAAPSGSPAFREDGNRRGDRVVSMFDVGIRAYLAPTPTGAYSLRGRLVRGALATDFQYLTNRLTGLVSSDEVQLHMLAIALGYTHGFGFAHAQLVPSFFVEGGYQFLRGESSGTATADRAFAGCIGARGELDVAFRVHRHRLRAGLDFGALRGIRALAVDVFGDSLELGGFHGVHVGFHVGYGLAERSAQR